MVAHSYIHNLDKSGGVNMRKLLLLLCILAVLSGWYLGNILKNTNEQGREGVVSVDVIVRHYRNGTLLSEQVKKGDPFTKNFAMLMYSLVDLDGYRCVSAVDTGGTSRSLCYDYSYSSSSYGERNYPYAAGTAIGIGTGTGAFSVNDYTLTNPIWATVSSPTVSIVGNKANITVSASFSLSAARTISEVGLKSTYEYGAGDGTAGFLLLRDVLSTPISAVAGDTVTVTYIIRING